MGLSRWQVIFYHRGQHHVDVVDAGQSEIGQFDLSGGRDQHILRFQVSMDDPVGVEEIHSAQNLVHQQLHTPNQYLK